MTGSLFVGTCIATEARICHRSQRTSEGTKFFLIWIVLEKLFSPLLLMFSLSSKAHEVFGLILLIKKKKIGLIIIQRYYMWFNYKCIGPVQYPNHKFYFHCCPVEVFCI